MPISATIQVSGENADELRAQLTELTHLLLVGENGSEPVIATGTDLSDVAEEKIEFDASDVAEAKIDRVFERVGPNIKRLLTTVATYEGGYSTRQLAKDLGLPLLSLRALHGNLGRTMAPINKELGNEPPIYRWNKSTNLYEMPQEIRAAILAKKA
jgi:hypothetical protein